MCWLWHAMPLQSQATGQEEKGNFDREQGYQLCYYPNTKRLFCKGVWLHPSQQCKDLKLKAFLKMAALMQRARLSVFFTRVTTNNRTENLCIEVTWEAKGHFLFLKGEKNNCSVGRRQKSQCLMDCSIASPEHNQLLWLIMVRQLETKIILVQTRGICYLHYKTQATGRAQKIYPAQE